MVLRVQRPQVLTLAFFSTRKSGVGGILKNSSGRLAKEASQYDLNEQAGADIGKVLIGQNSSLVWTKEGAQKFGTRAGAKVHFCFSTRTLARSTFVVDLFERNHSQKSLTVGQVP